MTTGRHRPREHLALWLTRGGTGVCLVGLAIYLYAALAADHLLELRAWGVIFVGFACVAGGTGLLGVFRGHIVALMPIGNDETAGPRTPVDRVRQPRRFWTQVGLLWLAGIVLLALAVRNLSATEAPASERPAAADFRHGV